MFSPLFQFFGGTAQLWPYKVFDGSLTCVTRSFNFIFCLHKLLFVFINRNHNGTIQVADNWLSGIQMPCNSPLFKWHLNTGTFYDLTVFDLLNTRRVHYSDLLCVMSSNMIHQKEKNKRKLAINNFINQQLGHFWII